MSSNIALGIAAVAFAALAVASIQSSKRLFAAIAAQDPDQNHLTRWPFFSQYGPLPPAQMSYLQKRRFLQLPEPALRALGRRALLLVYVYASAFLVFLLSLLWWSVSRGA